jgi:hypothetical protein
VVCAGSATQSRHWSYGAYTIDGLHFHAQRRVFSSNEECFEDGPAFSLQLRE